MKPVPTLLRSILRVFALLALFALPAGAQETISLLDARSPTTGWEFNNGQEFPGATGALTADPNLPRDGHPTLKVTGNFTKGGNYVSAGRKFKPVDIRELSLWVRNPGADHFSMRLNDASGQTHQIVLTTEPGTDWQHIVLPLERFFSRLGQADAVKGIAKYESWGGAKDGKWHGPATAIYILLSPTKEQRERNLWLGEVAITPRAMAVPGAETRVTLPLDEITDGSHDWRFSRGEEFAGAKGSLTVVKDTPKPGQTSLRLAGDFIVGGAYVAAIKELKELDVKDVTSFRLQARSSNTSSITIALVDSSGQTHQRKGVPIIPDGQWHELLIDPMKIAGGEHWGGANDGQWHGPPTQLALSLTNASDAKGKQPALDLTEIRAEALLPVFVQPPAFKGDFEQGAKLSGGWVTQGEVTIDPQAAYQGNGSLRLSRTLENTEQPCSAAGPKFPAAPGLWDLRLAAKASLHSPDNSYNATVHLECLDATGKVIDRLPLFEFYRESAWKISTKRVELPKGVAAARFQTQLNKSYGQFWLDDLSASYLAPSPRKDDRIARLLFSTAQVGNLLFPADSRSIGITVEAHKPLRDTQRHLTYTVRDYWGAPQTQPQTVDLLPARQKDKRLSYEASIDLAGAPLEVGRYYEIHAELPQEGSEPFRNYTSFAILPEAITRSYQPEEIPFTARSWDNRIGEYIRLSDRIGLRLCGIWGTWSNQPPYTPEAPTLDLAKQLGMGWVSGTPIGGSIELGKYTYDETALRQGVRHLIEKFGHVRPMIISLGNEPHGTGARVLANVAAYRAVYEEAKKVDPTIKILATAVEPNEEYFQAGYGQWCDAFDFHIYETAADVRHSIAEYQGLMEKYHVVKPIWSTELGLNSQGQTRQVVATELLKKTATFFAAGGENMSWFGIMYPDTEGKNQGTSGDSHNVFDCRYNRYAPRLDAIAYYNAVNGIAVKKFIAEKTYQGDLHAFLFRDQAGHSLQVLWKDQGRADVAIPLTGVKGVELIRIDGTRRALSGTRGALTLSITEDPLLLLYDSPATGLPETLLPAAAELVERPRTVPAGSPVSFAVKVRDAESGSLTLQAPPLWTVPPAAAAHPGAPGAPRSFTATPPASLLPREAEFTLTFPDRTGELYLRVPLTSGE